jgi:hypothetical protein
LRGRRVRGRPRSPSERPLSWSETSDVDRTDYNRTPPMRRGLPLIVVAAMLGTFVDVAEARGVVDRTKPAVSSILRSSLDLPDTDDPADRIAIHHIRIEPSTPFEGLPSVVLKFDLHNEGWTSVTDIVVSVSLRKDDRGTPRETSERVQPFTSKIRNVLLAGYSFDYEIRLRNLSFETDSVPDIQVVDVRPLEDDIF